MAWKEETIMSQKEEFIRRALERETCFSNLCREYQITRKTGYRLLHRYQAEGWRGLEPRSKKPLSSPFHVNRKVEEQIIETRLQFPTCGARKILKYLSNLGIKYLPAPSTTTLILKRNHLISIEESLKRQKLIRFEKEQPNELWQMDFKGKFQLLTKQTCYPLTIIDDCSRFSLTIKACANEQSVSVKQQLRFIFEKFGLPHQINVDNGNPWGNSKLLRHTALTVWLMRLGIRVSHSRPRHPQTNGKCERFHRTLKNDLIMRYPMRSFSHAQKLFDHFREQYNHVRPHEAIDMEVPAKRYQHSERVMPRDLPAIEYEKHAIVRNVRGNGYISYQNQSFLVGEAFKEHLVEIRHDELNRTIRIYFGKFQIYSYDF